MTFFEENLYNAGCASSKAFLNNLKSSISFCFSILDSLSPTAEKEKDIRPLIMIKNDINKLFEPTRCFCM
jgi:hypothetical protein